MSRIATLRLLALSALLLSSLLASAAFAQTTPTASDQSAVQLLNNAVFMLIVVIVVIALLVIIGGIILVARLRQLDLITRDQRTRLAEIQALYKELQGARKRTESALTMITGKSAELSNTRQELDVSIREALARMTQAVALLPVGENQYRAQDYGGAFATYRRAAELDDNNPLVHYRAGYTSIHVNQLEQAMAHLNRTLDIDADFAPGRAALGYLYRRMGENHEGDERSRANLYDEAERYLNEALMHSRRLLDEDGEAWVATLAGVYRRRRQYDQAIKLYGEASEITPFSSYPYAALALVYADKNDYAQMFKNYERVEWRSRNEISARPTNPWGHANLLLARLALGREDKLVEEEFTLAFLSLPKEGAFILPTLVSSLRRLEWALASAEQPGRAERVSHLLQRISRLTSSKGKEAVQATQVMRRTDSVRAARESDARRATGTQSTSAARTEKSSVDFNDWD
jgi:tetratricopeptide (TPR) repeat protein